LQKNGQDKNVPAFKICL